jgi:hypothetical protein
MSWRHADERRIPLRFASLLNILPKHSQFELDGIEGHRANLRVLHKAAKLRPSARNQLVGFERTLQLKWLSFANAVRRIYSGRDRDWDDVRGVLVRRHDKLDWSVVREEQMPTPSAAPTMQRSITRGRYYGTRTGA